MGLHCVLKELLCPLNCYSVHFIHSMSIKLITDKNFEVFPNSTYFSLASRIEYSPRYLNTSAGYFPDIFM